jgi:hypothetical protein
VARLRLRKKSEGDPAGLRTNETIRRAIYRIQPIRANSNAEGYIRFGFSVMILFLISTEYLLSR